MRGRYAAILVALLSVAVVPAKAPAFAVLAECGDTVLPPALGDSCEDLFGFGPPASFDVTLVLEPSAGFTGTLRGAIVLPGGVGAVPVGGVFVDGALVPGTGPSAVSFTLPAGDYRLTVQAGREAVCPFPSPVQPCRVPGFAVGTYHAGVYVEGPPFP